MVSIVNASGNQDIDGILWGWKWDAHHITYSFPTGTAEYAGYTAINGFQAFNGAQQDAVRWALAEVSSFCGLAFQETTVGGAYLRFAEATSINYTNNPAVARHTGLHVPGEIGTAEANPPELSYNGLAPYSPGYAQGDSWYTPGVYENPTLGSYERVTGLMHEIGHNLGLKHGHDAQYGHGTLFPALEANHDSYEYSVMTYRTFVGDPIYSGDDALERPTSFMQNDIAALQYMYGANFNYNSTDTVYTWSPTTGQSFINGVGQVAPSTNYILETIWDGGGIDTYDLSNYANGVTINLAPGTWSTFSQDQLANLGTDGEGGPAQYARGNVANARLYLGETASLIENAIGGAGEDRIFGNEIANHLQGGVAHDIMKGAGGADMLEGGEGDDELFGEDQNDTLKGGGGADDLYGESHDDTVTGGGGADRFWFNVPTDGVDTFTDFSSVEGDRLMISRSLFGIGGSPGTLAAAGINFELGPSATTAQPTILYDHGDVYWNPDGTGPAAPVLMAHVGGIDAVVVGKASGNGSGWSVVATGDFNNNGSTDVMWKNNADGSVAGWLMNRGSAASTPTYMSAAGWDVIATGDFNGNGTTDVLWRDGAGNTAAWYMSGAGVGSHPTLSSVAGWSVVATGDFNNNGADDILFKNDATGDTAVWLMGGGGIASSGFLWSAAGWNAAAHGDFNGDGTTDILWKNAADGSTAAWLMAGGTVCSGLATLNGAGWSVLTSGDFNDNGTDDILWKNDVTGDTAVWLMGAGGVESSEILLGSGGWDLVATGDFNYDGTDDLLWKNAADGSTAAWLMSGGDIGATATYSSAAGYTAVADGDFNRDGTTDVLWQSNADGSIIDWQFSHLTASSFLVL